MENHFEKYKKAKTSMLLANLVSTKYKEKRNIRKYIIEISNIASKVKAQKLDLFEHYYQFTVSYKTQKDK